MTKKIKAEWDMFWKNVGVIKNENKQNIALENVDVNLLYEQKIELGDLLDADGRKEGDVLWGIVHMFDTILDDLERKGLFVHPDRKETKYYLIYAKSIKMCIGMQTSENVESGYQLIQITKEEFDGVEDQADVNTVFEKYKDRVK